jgi:allophanate hydrolase subunit 2
MLRAGDEVRARRHDSLPVRFIFTTSEASPIRVVPGPDAFSLDALDRLLSVTWTVGRALDRTGMRFEGAKLPTPPDRPYSAPMVRGAIQVSHDGTPIVLGPDHPTTGGYSVIATVVRQDLGRLALTRPGETVRFEKA